MGRRDHWQDGRLGDASLPQGQDALIPLKMDHEG